MRLHAGVIETVGGLELLLPFFLGEVFLAKFVIVFILLTRRRTLDDAGEVLAHGMYVGQLLSGLLVLIHLPDMLNDLHVKVGTLDNAPPVLGCEPFQVEAVAYLGGHGVDAILAVGQPPLVLGHGEDLHFP